MDWKKLANRLLYPHWIIICILVVISATILVLALTTQDPASVLSILSYMIAFYTLVVVCLRVPQFIKYCQRIKQENKFVQRLITDINYRINTVLYISLFWNGAFAVFQLVLGIYHNSLWFYAMFVYYIMLAIIRFLLLGHTRKYSANQEAEKQTQKYCLCGWLLLLMNLALSVIITFIVYWNKTFVYHEIITITLALYTFVSFTVAIVSMITYRKYNSPVYSAAKMTGLIAASVSMLTLETTMLSTFSNGESTLLAPIMLGISGLVVAVFAITVAIIMIIKGHKKLKQIRLGVQKDTENQQNIA